MPPLTPTQQAESFFEDASKHFRQGDDKSLRTGLSYLADGLYHMARGMRATYQEVERNQRSIETLERHVREGGRL